MTMSDAYEQICERFPKRIPFPIIQKPYRSGAVTLADVQSAEDLPSRLIFGDLLSDSFKGRLGAWSVEYRDGFGNGIKLSVEEERFVAKLKFLGSESTSVGPAKNEQAFLQLINLASDVWDGALQSYLQTRFPIRVANPDRERFSAVYRPDGWMKTILVPIHPDKLERLLELHASLSKDLRIGANLSGDVSLQFNAVNYIEGRCPDALADKTELCVRTILQCGTPILSEPVREQANDGTAAWTIRRSAYLYRCNAFLRDVPYLVERLSQVGLLSEEPDMCAFIAPTELLIQSKEYRWFSLGNECRIVWVRETQDPHELLIESGVEMDESLALVSEAISASHELDRIFV